MNYLVVKCPKGGAMGLQTEFLIRRVSHDISQWKQDRKEWMEPEWHRQADESLSHCPRLNEHTPRPIFLFLRDFPALFSAANIIVSNNVIVFNVLSVSILIFQCTSLRR